MQDAGSTDETLSVLQEYPHLKVTCEKDQGMSDGINRGFRKATGDWLMWLNTDDYLLPGALTKVAEFVTRHPQADVIYGECLFVTETKELIRRKRDHPFDGRILLYYGCYISSTSTFLNHRIIAAGQLLDVDYRVCMDFEYYVRLWRAGYKFDYLPEALAGFRWHDANTSSVQLARRRQERLRVQQQHFEQTGSRRVPSERMLAVMARLYQGKRVLKRFWFRWLHPSN